VADRPSPRHVANLQGAQISLVAAAPAACGRTDTATPNEDLRAR